ncbi:hypothetical protein [Streptomyces sp. NPDC002640]
MLQRGQDLLLVLGHKGFPVPGEFKARVESCDDFELLGLWLSRALGARRLEEVFAPSPATADALPGQAVAPEEGDRAVAEG